jgi:predicted  nucleic acid-binding Zn-ribbon protein
MKILQDLLELQSVDTRLQAVRTRLASFPKRSADAEKYVTAAKAELEAAKAAQVAVVRDRKKYELDVEQWKERVRKYKDQTSQVKTNEAFKALQHEVDNGEKEIANAEDRLLEQMVAGEQYEREIKASEKLVKEAEDVAKVERAKIESEKRETEADLAQLNAERERAVSEIPEDMMDHYDRIMKKHDNMALAEVRDEKCSACGMRMRPQVIQAMRRSTTDELFHCETCTRILYYVEPTAAAAIANAQPASPASTTRHHEN